MQNPRNAPSPRCPPPSRPSLSTQGMTPDVCAPHRHCRRSDTALPSLLVPLTGSLAPFNYVNVNGLLHGLHEQEPSTSLAYGRSNTSVALRPEFSTLPTSVGYPESAQRTQINDAFLEHFNFSSEQTPQNLVDVSGNLMYTDQHPRQIPYPMSKISSGSLSIGGNRTTAVSIEKYGSLLPEPPEGTAIPLHEISTGIDSQFLFPAFSSHYRSRDTGTPSSSSLDGAVCDKSRDRTSPKAHSASRGVSIPELSITPASMNTSLNGVPQTSVNDREYSSPRPTQRKSKMHECEVCHKQFPRPSGLATHMNSHSGAKREFQFLFIVTNAEYYFRST
jgi:hypothetical protein